MQKHTYLHSLDLLLEFILRNKKRQNAVIDNRRGQCSTCSRKVFELLYPRSLL